MIAILIMDLPAEYNTEITLIERDPKERFKYVVEQLQTRKQRLKVSQGEPSNVNYVQHPLKKGKLPPCDICGRRNHPTSKCFFKDEKMEKKDSKKRNRKEKRGENGRASEVTDIPIMSLQMERIILEKEDEDMIGKWKQKTTMDNAALNIETKNEIIVDSGPFIHFLVYLFIDSPLT